MRGVVANSGMRALGLAPMNEELDNAVTALYVRWEDGGPSYQVRTGLSDHNSDFNMTL